MDVSEPNAFPFAWKTESYFFGKHKQTGLSELAGFLTWFLSCSGARVGLSVVFKQNVNLRKPVDTPTAGRLLKRWASFTLPKLRASTVVTQGAKYPEFGDSKTCSSWGCVGAEFIFCATAAGLWTRFSERLILQWLSPCACFLTSFWFISPQGIEMEIVDSCQDNNGGCSHRCEHTAAGPRCSCDDGYRLGSDGKTCAGNSWQMLHLHGREEEVWQAPARGGCGRAVAQGNAFPSLALLLRVLINTILWCFLGCCSSLPRSACSLGWLIDEGKEFCPPNGRWHFGVLPVAVAVISLCPAQASLGWICFLPFLSWRQDRFSEVLPAQTPLCAREVALFPSDSLSDEIALLAVRSLTWEVKAIVRFVFISREELKNSVVF